MPRKYRTTEQIIQKLREGEILLSQGQSTEFICKKLEVNHSTFYRWRKQYGGMKIDQAKEHKKLKDENAKLKKIIAELNLEKLVLKEALEGNY